MEIDKWQVTGSDEAIVLFPRSYNKRGDERLHSVQGVTLDGREVNIKLRIDASMATREGVPSIAEFSREDVKAKNPCLAFADNGPDNREGILLFTGCEEDGENRKGIQSYTARWAYVLASHSDSPEPVYGLGRIVMIADSHAAKQIHAELTELERTRPEGWHALVEHKRKALNDPMLFSYYGHVYHTEMEESFQNTEDLSAFAARTFEGLTGSGIVGGLLIRMKGPDGQIVPGFSAELFPRWIGNNQYQKADDAMLWFFRSNAKRIKDNEGGSFLAMPIKRYSSGPSFKNYYFLRKPEDSLQKIRKRYLINNEPTVGLIAFALSRKEENGDCFLLKYYPLSNPVSAVGLIGVDTQGQQESFDDLKQLDPSIRIPAGLAGYAAIAFPSWYNAGAVLDIRAQMGGETAATENEEEDGEDLSNLLDEISDERLDEISSQELLDDDSKASSDSSDQENLDEPQQQTDEAYLELSLEQTAIADSQSPSTLAHVSRSDAQNETSLDTSEGKDSIQGDNHDQEANDLPIDDDDGGLNFDDLEDEEDTSHDSALLATDHSVQDSLSIYDSASEGAATYNLESQDDKASQQDAESSERVPEKENHEELTGLARFMKNKGLL